MKISALHEPKISRAIQQAVGKMYFVKPSLRAVQGKDDEARRPSRPIFPKQAGNYGSYMSGRPHLSNYFGGALSGTSKI
jgi:hypothetical protein